MSKYCGKCGLQLADDDFLCPKCGAIWGDRVYRVPVISEEPELEVQEETEIAPTKVTRHHWLPVVIAICAVLLATLLLLTDWDFGAGERGTENTTIPQTSTTLPPQVSIPSSVPPSVIKKYTVRFVNAAGEGVPGVEVEYTHGNPLLSVLTLKDTTDEGGYVTFYYQGSAEPFVYILSIPDGYSRLSIKNYYRYSDGVKDLVIVLQSEATYHNYKVDMLDPAWLCPGNTGTRVWTL